MKEQIVSFETAKLLKEVGFDEICNTSYTENGEVIYWYPHECFYGYRLLSESINYFPKNSGGIIELSAPTQSLAQKWLREKYDMNVESRYIVNSKDYAYIILPPEKTTPHGNYGVGFETYEQSFEKGLLKALKIIKNKV